jgi:3,4-dihydroxy-2-butanone 4-phosphate synthase
VPAGVLCEVVNDDGTMARGPNLLAFCRRHSLPLVTVEDIACHLRSRSLTAV